MKLELIAKHEKDSRACRDAFALTLAETTATMDHRPTAAPRITYSGGRTEDRSLLYARLYRYRYRAVSNANRFTGSAGSTDSSIHSCWSR